MLHIHEITSTIVISHNIIYTLIGQKDLLIFDFALHSSLVCLGYSESAMSVKKYRKILKAPCQCVTIVTTVTVIGCYLLNR